jgi:hypothetical protein
LDGQTSAQLANLNTTVKTLNAATIPLTSENRDRLVDATNTLKEIQTAIEPSIIIDQSSNPPADAPHNSVPPSTHGYDNSYPRPQSSPSSREQVRQVSAMGMIARQHGSE